MRFPDRQPVDPVSPVDEPRADEQYILVDGASKRAQQTRDHRARVGPQHLRLAHVARVPRIARRCVGRIPETLVVVGHRSKDQIDEILIGGQPQVAHRRTMPRAGDSECTADVLLHVIDQRRWSA